MTAKHLDHYIRLGLEARADVEWWAHYAGSWNGISMMMSSNIALTQLLQLLQMLLVIGTVKRIQIITGTWTGPVASYHITVKEMLPIVIALGHGLAG